MPQYWTLFPNFLLLLTFCLTDHLQNYIYFERDWSKFDQNNLIFDCLSGDWGNLIKSNNENVDQLFVSFLTKFNSIVDLYTPLKKLSRQKLKFKNKPWITLGLKRINFH